jgi:predicted dehydrogenase
VVAICTPYTVHREQLEIVARAGSHCLCEKPLWWRGEGENVRVVTAELAEAFARQGLLLDLVTQWPFTLHAFDALHANARSEPLRTFEMILSPLSRGAAMIPDAAPHVFSLLYALAGHGEVHDPVTRYPDGSEEHMSLRFRYRHAAGETTVSCRFGTMPAGPRPAAYAINGRWVHRKIRLPGYGIEFESEGKSVRAEDPLILLVRDFVQRMTDQQPTDGPKLVAGMVALEAVAASAARAVAARGAGR